MLKKLFSILDVKMSQFNGVFHSQDAITATRILHTATRDSESQIHQFPEDFQLFEMGEFDDITGKLIPLDRPKLIVTAMSLKQKDNTISFPHTLHTSPNQKEPQTE